MYALLDVSLIIGEQQAVYLEENGDIKLYFVLETKGTSFELALSPSERLKYHCDEAHF